LVALGKRLLSYSLFVVQSIGLVNCWVSFIDFGFQIGFYLFIFAFHFWFEEINFSVIYPQYFLVFTFYRLQLFGRFFGYYLSGVYPAYK
jgi:hypothetical protein